MFWGRPSILAIPIVAALLVAGLVVGFIVGYADPTEPVLKNNESDHVEGKRNRERERDIPAFNSPS